MKKGEKKKSVKKKVVKKGEKKNSTKRSTAIKKVNKNQVKQIKVNSQMIDDYLFGTGTKLEDHHKMVFKNMAKMFNLNPFKREIYAVPFRNKKTGKMELSVITGYEVYLKRGERSGKLDGWNVKIEGTKNNESATITINRKDFKNPIIHTVYMTEYNNDRNLWKYKPLTMLRKVAIAQGFRLAFPDELGGMPYIAEEYDKINEAKKEKDPKNITPLNKWSEPEKEMFKKIGEVAHLLGKNANQIKEEFKINDYYEFDLKALQDLKKVLDGQLAKQENENEK